MSKNKKISTNTNDEGCTTALPLKIVLKESDDLCNLTCEVAEIDSNGLENPVRLNNANALYRIGHRLLLGFYSFVQNTGSATHEQIKHCAMEIFDGFEHKENTEDSKILTFKNLKMRKNEDNSICMSMENMWNQNESKNGDAIIAIDENGCTHMIAMLTSDDDKIRIKNKYDDILQKLTCQDTPPGLYYANMKIRQMHEDIEVNWEISQPLYPIIMNNYITLIVNSYDFSRNMFSATTDKYEVVEFDPFGGCAIEQTDEEYYNQDIAPTIIGHKFIVKSLVPLPDEIIFTTWKNINDKNNPAVNK